MKEEFFNKDSPASFYWAGFIAADGNIYEKYTGKFVFQMSLGKQDVCHIKRFLKLIDCPNKIHKDRNCRRIAIYSNKLCSGLDRFNVVPRKTNIYKIPKWLLLHPLLNHFIRGYSDGDGSFFEHNNKNIGQLVFSVRGTKEFLEQLEQILRRELGLKYKKVETSSGYPMIRYEGNRSATVIRDFLYRGSTEEIRLERKYLKSKPFIYHPHLRKAKPIRAINKSNIIDFESITDAERKGYTRSSIHKCLNGKQGLYRGYKWEYKKQ